MSTGLSRKLPQPDDVCLTRPAQATEEAASTQDAACPRPVPQSLPDVLKVDEVAALLRCDRKTVYGLVRRDELPGAKRLGRVLRFSKQALLDWLAETESSR